MTLVVADDDDPALAAGVGTAAAAPARGRPRGAHGEVRQAVFRVLRAAQAPLSQRDIAQAAGIAVPLRAVKWTLANALANGGVRIAGHEKRAHCTKWVALYELVPAAADAPPAGDAQGEPSMEARAEIWRVLQGLAR